MTRTPTPVERQAIRTGYAALHESQSPNSEIVEQVVYALGAADLLRAVAAPAVPSPLPVVAPQRVMTTDDGTRWERRGTSSSGDGLYAVEGSVPSCPAFVMATLPELARHGLLVLDPMCADPGCSSPPRPGSPWCSTTCRNRDDRHDDGAVRDA
ncbi:hypothetical protein [Streptomyces sp. NPDC050504]|uniref:hypothetical protein n=1 Tax=Streptomyces sp. NPDC050504 TaxID=3365618 RepID=UPI0037A1ADBE